MIRLVILHGSSATGKTYMMNKIVQANNRFVGLEMDACKYWNDYEPNLEIDRLQALNPGNSEKVDAFRDAYLRCSVVNRRCLAYLASQLAMLAAAKTKRRKRRQVTVISTCGGLPTPNLDKASIYHRLAEVLPIELHHILIEIPEDVHEARMKKRGRFHLREEIRSNYERRTANREVYNCIISDYQDLVAYLKKITGWSPPEDSITLAELEKVVRIHKKSTRDLKYIQMFGERNSGTNHLKNLVSSIMREPGNFLGSYATKKDSTNRAKLFGYKHYYANPKKTEKHVQRETLFLVLYKNPYTWIRSMIGKPYHFRGSLEGKSIVDLGDLKMEGIDARGQPTPDVHPETGEPVSLFELRAHKIRNWEALGQRADNVVYINYEHLLTHPTEIVQTIVDNFGSLFVTDKVDEIKTDAKYVRKYRNPAPFTAEEMRVMDEHIDWEVERAIGYEKGNLFI